METDIDGWNMDPSAVCASVGLLNQDTRAERSTALHVLCEGVDDSALAV